MAYYRNLGQGCGEINRSNEDVVEKRKIDYHNGSTFHPYERKNP